MTTLVSPPEQMWHTMPGWGIVANLIPPEIVAARRLATLRKVIVVALVAVLLLAGAGFGYAYWQVHRASNQLAAEKGHTTSLLAQQQRYGEIVRINSDITHIQGQLQTLLGSDVDVPTLMVRVLAVHPPGTTLSQATLTLNAGSTSQSNQAAAGTGAGMLDASGQTHIGTIALTGQTTGLPAVAAYVTALAALPGVVAVYPTSQQNNGKVVQFTIQLTLTDELLSHRYAAPAAGGTNPGGTR